MKLERQRAQEMGVESPVFDHMDGTHESYNSCMQVRQLSVVFSLIFEAKSRWVCASVFGHGWVSSLWTG